MSIDSKGFWKGTEASTQHYHDTRLAQCLVSFFKNEGATSIVDFGCGMGTYVKNFGDNGLNATGFDGNPNTPELTNNTCKVVDLSVPFQFEPFDWVMSLEVGEHLPPQFEDIFIHNLHNNNKRGIVLSWAIKGQGGHGHVNEQDTSYIKSKICKLGYLNDIDSENTMRNMSSLSWFKNTIMVFRRI
jgi:cyclopropane fatty-acyl-phospholipid synthase-like methyltransferase